MSEVTRSTEWRSVGIGTSQPLALDLFCESLLFARIVDVNDEFDAGPDRVRPTYAVEVLRGQIWDQCDDRFTDIDIAESFAAAVYAADRRRRPQKLVRVTPADRTDGL